ncbi:MAG: DUF4102 domain-containing protein [Deltaproteobacteria bacterium]|nr:MAG: DUF4102 domain-containing protein [Deltaproteobacteria bacterium]
MKGDPSPASGQNQPAFASASAAPTLVNVRDGQRCPGAQPEPGTPLAGAVAVRAGGYQPRSSEGSVLHGLVRDHLETFLQAAIARGEGTGLPDFVEREFRDFLGCGVLARGFARVRCGDCAFERLVPFSCKGRGFCPSCGGRRMAAQASHLVDAVLPRVAVRQWVLSLRKYRSGGRENRLSLGVYPDVSLKAARAKRDAARQQLAAGIDPGQARKAEKLAQAGAECFEAIAREWHAKFSPGWVASHGDRTLRHGLRRQRVSGHCLLSPGQRRGADVHRRGRRFRGRRHAVAHRDERARRPAVVELARDVQVNRRPAQRPGRPRAGGRDQRLRSARLQRCASA